MHKLSNFIKTRRVLAIVLLVFIILFACVGTVSGISYYQYTQYENAIANNEILTIEEQEQIAAEEFQKKVIVSCLDQKVRRVVAVSNQWKSAVNDFINGNVCYELLDGSDAGANDEYTVTNIENADIVILNGAGVDDWANSYIKKDTKVFNVSQLAPETAKTSPYLWFSVDAIEKLGNTLQDYFTTQNNTITQQIIESGNNNYENSEYNVDCDNRNGGTSDDPAHTGEADECNIINKDDPSQTKFPVIPQHFNQNEANANFTKHLEQIKNSLEFAKQRIAAKGFVSLVPYLNNLLFDVGDSNNTPPNIEKSLLNNEYPSKQAVDDIKQATQFTQYLVTNDRENLDLSNELTAIANEFGVKIINITREKPEDADTLYDWYSSIINELTSNE